jgi:type IV pilus assembly protein PilF
MTTPNDYGLNRPELYGVNAEHRIPSLAGNAEQKAGWIIFVLLLTFFTACSSADRRKEEALSHMRLGDSMLREGQPTQALAELIKANELDPSNPVIGNVLGIAYLEKGMIRQAITQFEKALYLDPKYVEVHNNLGTALLRDQKVKEAIVEFNKALENPMYPTPHFVYYNLGQAYFILNELEKARANYLEAIKLSPAYSLAYHGLALTWKSLGNLKEAAEALKKAIEYAPQFAQAHYDFGEVLLELKQPALAVLAFREVIHLVPESDLGRRAQQRLKELQ